jgi:hypothetical protein
VLLVLVSACFLLLVIYVTTYFLLLFHHTPLPCLPPASSITHHTLNVSDDSIVDFLIHTNTWLSRSLVSCPVRFKPQPHVACSKLILHRRFVDLSVRIECIGDGGNSGVVSMVVSWSGVGGKIGGAGRSGGEVVMWRGRLSYGGWFSFTSVLQRTCKLCAKSE